MSLNEFQDNVTKGNIDNFSLTNMLDQIGYSNPKVRLMAKLIESQNSVSENSGEHNSKLNKLESLLKKMEAYNEKFKQENTVLKEHIKSITAWSNNVAAAVGACPECWGENDLCNTCHGQGLPGKFIPNKTLFTELCMPAVQYLYRQIERNNKTDEPIDKVD